MTRIFKLCQTPEHMMKDLITIKLYGGALNWWLKREKKDLTMSWENMFEGLRKHVQEPPLYKIFTLNATIQAKLELETVEEST